jgi:hypothetical protein
MNANIATEISRSRARCSPRAVVVLALGPLTVMAGAIWAIAQPWRVTLLHPHGQSFWWLFVEPPLLVALAGLAFHFFVAQPVVGDLEETER